MSVEGASGREMLREPVPGVLLGCDGGWVLLDTGFSTALIRDPALRKLKRIAAERGYRLVPGHDPVAWPALAAELAAGPAA